MPLPPHRTVGLQQARGCLCISLWFSRTSLCPAVGAAAATGSHLTPAASGHSRVPPWSWHWLLVLGCTAGFQGWLGLWHSLTIGEEARQVEDLPPQHIGPKGGGHRLMTHLQNQQRQKKDHCGSARRFLLRMLHAVAAPTSLGASAGTLQCLGLGPTLAPI